MDQQSMDWHQIWGWRRIDRRPQLVDIRDRVWPDINFGVSLAARVIDRRKTSTLSSRFLTDRIMFDLVPRKTRSVLINISADVGVYSSGGLSGIGALVAAIAAQYNVD